MPDMFVISFCSEAFELQDNDTEELAYVASSFETAMSFIEANYVKKQTNGHQFKAIRWDAEENLVNCMMPGDQDWDNAVSFFKIEKVQFIG